ncbi:MAG TPA: hypothetical protein VFK38_03145 [Candidatus Limnocylindrales bacterium]|nr:hypothetical protein [Candidatus Limnocylindrales bacterium]
MPVRSPWLTVAGIVLLVDAAAALLLLAVIVVLSTFSVGMPNPASGPGPERPSVLLPALGTLAVAVGAGWSGLQILRGRRHGRLAGIAAALVVAAVGILSLPTADLTDPSQLAFSALLIVPQVVVLVALLRWPGEATAPNP